MIRPGYNDIGLPTKHQTQQGAKKISITTCHLGKLKLTFTSPNIISTSPKNVLISRRISQFFCNLNSSKIFTCMSGKLITEFTNPIAKFTSPGLSDTTFFSRCLLSNNNNNNNNVHPVVFHSTLQQY